MKGHIMANSITVAGNGYGIRAFELTDGTWAIDGYAGDYYIDSIWMECEIRTFEDADDIILDFISQI